MIEPALSLPQNETAIMLDQLWRIVAYAVIQGFFFAVGMWPILRYGLKRTR